MTRKRIRGGIRRGIKTRTALLSGTRRVMAYRALCHGRDHDAGSKNAKFCHKLDHFYDKN